MALKSSLPSLAADPDSMIHRLRRTREISIDDLSRVCNIPAADIRRWERTNAYPSKEQLCAIAKALHVDASVLTGKPRDYPLPSVSINVPSWFIAETQHILALFPQRR